MRVAFVLAYNGTHFLGSQVQKSSHNTVFGQLEHVLRRLGIEEKTVASGRTDKGVHASYQVAHVDLPDFWTDLNKLKRVLNEMLPSSIKVKKVFHVQNNFHARYSAKSRVYRYIIKTGQSNPFEADFVTFLEEPNFNILQQNIKLFIGQHDFANFMKTGSDTKSSVREIYKAFAYKHKEYIVLYFEANGYLRTQIRFMVGALLDLSSQQIHEKLNCKINHKLKPAPANGLYLAKVKY
ncbi:tRNA pseudouridine(38-40) synthase TruA [Sulfurimonas sp. C5]|uniref:tRNA pseudouridine(38-40) synthase TruA n=1 Tax=Sulfurimonas sp. C5 TaxID=3036947 RepID=UPI002453BA0D|nr:tRNA pseudouridine(38-40) synthase TruA [Sulfurimonas sp. C5]MDH4943795.1 tRNA pseudouridine(38-40) synthase TruA [Sulfurimonas sp. C5]